MARMRYIADLNKASPHKNINITLYCTSISMQASCDISN